MQKTWARGTTLTMIKIRRNGREEVEINSFFLFYVAGEKKVIELKLPFFGWIDVLYPSPSTALEMLNNFIFITASDPKYIFLLSWLFFFSTLLLLFFLSFWLGVVITVLVRPPCCDIFRCFFGKKNCVDFAATCKLIDWCSHLIYSTFHFQLTWQINAIFANICCGISRKLEFHSSQNVVQTKGFPSLIVNYAIFLFFQSDLFTPKCFWWRIVMTWKTCECITSKKSNFLGKLKTWKSFVCEKAK